MGGIVGSAIGTALSANPIGAALTAAGLAAQIFGAVKGGQAMDRNQRLLNDMQTENENFYNQNVNRDFLETNAAKGIFEQLRKRSEEQNKIAANTAAVTGGTAEAEIAAKAANNDSYNQSVNQLAQGATQYQTQQEAMFRGQKANLNAQQMQMNDMQAESAANMAGNAADVMGAGATLSGFGEVPTGNVLPQTDQLNMIAKLGANNILSQQPKMGTLDQLRNKKAPFYIGRDK